MNRNDLIRTSLSHVFERRTLFANMNEEINTFIKKYEVARWLSLNQAYTIHEILLSGDKETIIKRLEKYKELQLKRASEKDRWQKMVDKQRAIDYFYEMITGLFDRYLSVIKLEFEEKFRLMIEESDHPMIYQNLIRTFDYIFITQIRILKEG